MESAPAVAVSSPYALSSELARLCLPAATRDANRKLAYANSVCFLFLFIGLVGLKMPKPYVRPLPEVVDYAPVVFTPPDQPPPTTTDQPPPDQPEDTRDVTTDAPVVATVVAADASKVAFAVPVHGPVILAPARYAAAPPPQLVKAPPPQPTKFIPRQGEAGSYPWPKEYPRQALASRQEGTVMLFVSVGADGVPAQVEVKDSSGYSSLDRFAAQWVREKWRWPPGATRLYYVPFEFHLR
jgi:protein TonB